MYSTYVHSNCVAVSVTVKREFMEEALDSTGSNKDSIEDLRKMLGDFFDSGIEIYKGIERNIFNGG